MIVVFCDICGKDTMDSNGHLTTKEQYSKREMSEAQNPDQPAVTIPRNLELDMCKPCFYGVTDAMQQHIKVRVENIKKERAENDKLGQE